MKTILASLVLALSFAAQAGSGSYIQNLKAQSWEQLSKNWDIDFEGDQVWFGGKIVSVLDTCMADEETIRTSNKVTIEEQDGDYWVVVGEDYLYKSIYGTKVMVDGDGTVDVPVTHATTRMIRVVENDDDFQGELLFKKEFTIPACE